MKLSNNQIKAYVENKRETFCPSCGSKEIEGSSVTTGGGGASQEMGCNSCELEWMDHYTIETITVDGY